MKATAATATAIDPTEDAHTMLDLCSGIGGMSLGAALSGVRTVAFAEIEPFCCELLAYHFPGVPNLGDLYGITKDIVERLRERVGHIDIVAGGIPCQPWSVAGKRRGAADDRHLWPAMLAVIELVKPTWVVIENVSGFVTLALDSVSADLESRGYEARAFVLPACAVGAPHLRERVFVVAYRDSELLYRDWSRGQGRRSEDSDRRGVGQADADSRRCDGKSSTFGRGTSQGQASRWASSHCEAVMADATPRGPRCRTASWQGGQPALSGEGALSMAHASESGRRARQRPLLPRREQSDAQGRGQTGVGLADTCSEGSQGPGTRWTAWQPGRIEPSVGRAAYGLSEWMDRHPWPAGPAEPQHEWEAPRVTQERLPRRAARLKALGNAIVPAQVAPIFAAIVEVETERAIRARGNAL